MKISDRINGTVEDRIGQYRNLFLITLLTNPSCIFMQTSFNLAKNSNINALSHVSSLFILFTADELRNGIDTRYFKSYWYITQYFRTYVM